MAIGASRTMENTQKWRSPCLKPGPLQAQEHESCPTKGGQGNEHRKK